VGLVGWVVSRDCGDLFADEVEGFVGSEATGVIWLELGEEPEL